jgi:hypothetical protein
MGKKETFRFNRFGIVFENKKNSCKNGNKVEAGLIGVNLMPGFEYQLDPAPWRNKVFFNAIITTQGVIAVNGYIDVPNMNIRFQDYSVKRKDCKLNKKFAKKCAFLKPMKFDKSVTKNAVISNEHIMVSSNGRDGHYGVIATQGDIANNNFIKASGIINTKYGVHKLLEF